MSLVSPTVCSGLLTDLYQLTMAAGYHHLGMHERRAVFHLFFRKPPFGGAYALTAGVTSAMRFLEELRFEADDLDYLATLRGADDQPLFRPAFLELLAAAPPGLGLDVDGMLDGTPAFPREPLLRVSGPLWAGQLVETPLLTMVNFETLIATKASRICRAAEGPVLEFGLRRAQGVDGGLSASRAAYIGGVASTSNVLAGKQAGIPVRGTHAHSWVMCFPDELTAFESYAAALPNNVVLLVDTYDTHEGVEHAIEVGRGLAARGHRLLGIRLDSGDLVALSQHARSRLDAAGLTDTVIVASDDLDEHRITALRAAGARIDVWGVGTRLVTGHDQPALGGVYKLGAIAEDGGWRYAIKRSENPIKVSDPGILGVRRLRDPAGRAAGDVLHDVDMPPDAPGEDLLQPLLRGGRRVGALLDVHAARARAAEQLALLPPDVLRLSEAATYPVGTEPRLAARKAEMLARAGR